MHKLRSLIKDKKLHTVCQAAHCPNIGYCWQNGTATFMILGDVCTRRCRFCAVPSGQPTDVDHAEPWRVAEAVRILGLRYAVITSVSRDDLPDGGAEHFAATCREIRRLNPGILIELLIPDFGLDTECLERIIRVRPDVVGHNLETVPALYPSVRPGADYRRSLGVLRYLSRKAGKMVIKSGFMVGLGETGCQIKGLLNDLRAAGCTLVTIGQYLAPSRTERHVPVWRFVPPEEFEKYERIAYDQGFHYVVSGPLVRSSYKAEEGYRAHGHIADGHSGLSFSKGVMFEKKIR